VGLLVLILLIVGVKSCSDSSRKNGLRDYNRQISALVQKSDTDVSRPLFRLLSSAGGDKPNRAVEMQNQVNNLKVEAEDQLSRAQRLDLPDQATDAQRSALLALELRRNGVTNIAKLLQPALGGTDGGQAVQRVAGEMRNFDASDVIWSQFAHPLITRALKDGNVEVGGSNGETVTRSRFLVNLGWLDPTYVADKLGSGGGDSGGPVKPGSHGHGITGVSVGDTSLTPGGVTRLPSADPPVFSVKLQNQGENEESDVRVRVRVSGSGAPINATKTVPSTKAGQTATASVTLPKPPPTGKVLTVRAEVVKVGGEKKTDNNVETFQVLFTE
jgi:CARDB